MPGRSTALERKTKWSLGRKGGRKKYRWTTSTYASMVCLLRQGISELNACRIAQVPLSAYRKHQTEGRRDFERFYADDSIPELSQAGHFYMRCEEAKGLFQKELTEQIYALETTNSNLNVKVRLLEKTDPDQWGPGAKPLVAPPVTVNVNANANAEAKQATLLPAVEPAQAKGKVYYEPVVLDGKDWEQRRLPDGDTVDTELLPVKAETNGT